MYDDSSNSSSQNTNESSKSSKDNSNSSKSQQTSGADSGAMSKSNTERSKDVDPNTDSYVITVSKSDNSEGTESKNDSSKSSLSNSEESKKLDNDDSDKVGYDTYSSARRLTITLRDESEGFSQNKSSLDPSTYTHDFEIHQRKRVESLFGGLSDKKNKKAKRPPSNYPLSEMVSDNSDLNVSISVKFPGMSSESDSIRNSIKNSMWQTIISNFKSKGSEIISEADTVDTFIENYMKQTSNTATQDMKYKRKNTYKSTLQKFYVSEDTASGSESQSGVGAAPVWYLDHTQKLKGQQHFYCIKRDIKKFYRKHFGKTTKYLYELQQTLGSLDFYFKGVIKTEKDGKELRNIFKGNPKVAEVDLSGMGKGSDLFDEKTINLIQKDIDQIYPDNSYDFQKMFELKGKHAYYKA